MNEVLISSNGAWSAACRSDPGRIRTNNEDLPIVDAARGIYGVIDGIGGQAAGEIAAGIARDVILQRLARPLGTPAERVREALAIANNEIYSRAEAVPDLRGMACVVTLALVADGTLTIGHVGDTRLYKVRPESLQKLTHDHSPVGEREDALELTEAEAMKHPRRNEVFRDLGSARRDKDEQDFVEVIVEPLERDSAILLCSDGLTDMVPSSAIERLVRRYAGAPQSVTDALVEAANAAGGKDNVTVVYAESSEFAPAVRRSPAGRGPAASPDAPAPPVGTSHEALTPSWPKRVLRSRTTWFTAGALAGVAGALVLAWQLGTLGVRERQTLTVGAGGGARFTSITDAMAVAQANDIVRVEPGVYRERVILRNGVDLMARIPGTVTVARPSNASGEVVGISVFGSASSSVSGFRIESSPANAVDVGLRISGQGVTLEQMEFAGPMRAGIDVLPAGSLVVRGSLFAVQGPALTLGDESSAIVTSNTILRTGRTGEGPFAMAASSHAVFRRNVFAGFGTDVVRDMPPALRQQLLGGNYVVAAEPSLLR